MCYAIVVVKEPTSFGACAPKLPGCVAAAVTRDEVLVLIREAIQLHLNEMREDGTLIPEPSTSNEYVEVVAA